MPTQGGWATAATDWLKAWGLFALWLLGTLLVVYVITSWAWAFRKRAAFRIAAFNDPTDELRIGATFTAALAAELRHTEPDGGSLGIVRDASDKGDLPI